MATANSASAFFTGGKMEHIFAWKDDTQPGTYGTDGSCSSPGAKEAMLHGDMFYKIDGANGMIQVVPPTNSAEREEGESTSSSTFRAFERLDTKGKGKTNEYLMDLPPGKNPSEYKGHTYFYEQVTTNVTGKKLLKRNKAMLDLLERHADKLKSFGREFISVEWVGRKFQQTPNVDEDVAMAIHQDQKVVDDVTIPRSYEGIRKFLLEESAAEPVEGLIFAHEGLYYKAVTKCFDLPEGTKSPFGVNRNKARAPVYLA